MKRDQEGRSREIKRDEKISIIDESYRSRDEERSRRDEVRCREMKKGIKTR